ncbi:hypothetical protein [Streptomyces sp. ST2-7A]|uniref:hypothetical protein n=1 Tax=Streptomyces sp. ST2-7A TaxID=2907214 RepID=UPI001F21A6DE|nr:hypothetical protein [Streptomyces sp. ST2-7A]MCE7081868.1 hypothetical protein [Streptomyces sp. ST2-7A]
MSHRRARAALMVPILTALALLTACGGSAGGDHGTDDNAGPIRGADTPDTETDDKAEEADAPEATTTEDEDGIERPEIVLPDDMVNIFEDTETGDPEKDAILADLQRRTNSVDMAVSLGDPYHEAISFYSYGDAWEAAEEYVRSASTSGEEGRTWAGTVIYYDFEVTIPDRGDPMVEYCSDRTDSHTKDLATGELLTAEDGSQHVGSQRRARVWVRESESHAGVWQVAGMAEPDTEEDARCQR